MRIVQVIANVAPRLGGPSKAVLEMSAALAAQGHTVDVLTTSLAHRGSWTRWASAEDVLSVETGRRLLRDGYYITFCQPTWPTRWGASGQLTKVLRHVIPQADVVHIHSLYQFHTLVASRLARAFRVPYVIRPHGTLDPYIRRRHRFVKALYNAVVENSTLRHAAIVHFTSEEERDLAAPAMPSGVRSAVVPLGVNVGAFGNLPDRLAARRSLGIDPQGLVWLFLGRLNHKKGLDLLAPAFIQFSRRMPRSWMIVAGPDDDGLGSTFLAECSAGGVADRVTLTGFVEGDEMKRVLAAADFWILPSYSENFGVAVVEAMAAKLPVLISDRVNIWRPVHESRAGVVTCADVSSVLEGMLRLARLSPGERTAMGERGRELCQRSFSWRNSARELTALYAAIAKERERS